MKSDTIIDTVQNSKKTSTKTGWEEMKHIITTALIATIIVAGGGSAIQAQLAPVSIYDIQYTTDPAGDSPINGNVVDCAGGIVIHKYDGFFSKLTLFDPANASGWGGIAVKDFTANKDAFTNINVGDWVSFSSVTIEESRGNTQLMFTKYDAQYQDPDSGLSVVSPGNALPAPILLSPDNIAAPDYSSDPAGWFVGSHMPTPEMYEGMYVQIEDVTVGDMGLGKASDNYALQNALGLDCWASDYMSAPEGELYLPGVYTGRHFDSAAGIIEQYTKTSSGWDYYQMLTTGPGDLVPEPLIVTLLLIGSEAVLRKRRNKI